MSICDQCQKTVNPPLCVTALIIGTIADLTTAVYVYQKHIGSGRTVRYDVTSDGAGLVSIEPQSLMAHQPYEYWITATNSQDKKPITVDGTAYDCLLVEYDKINDAITGDSETYASITISV